MTFRGLLFLCFCASPICNEVLAEPQNTVTSQAIKPVLIEADEVTFDQSLGLTTARGNVQITASFTEGLTILRAETVTFNEKTHIATAAGNVHIFDPKGDVYKSDYVELTDDLKSGLIQTIKLLTKENYRLIARDGTRRDGLITEFNQAVYSPCNLCKENPENPPLWQIKAMKVIRDESSGYVKYHDAWLEMGGFPVLYTPYFTHPDPSIERQSGILNPIFGTSKDLGIMSGFSYYHVINSSEDLTLSPMFFTKESPVLMGEYRRRFARGEWSWQGSITQSKSIGGTTSTPVQKPARFRGHIQSKGKFDLNDQWRMGFDLNRASDPTYIRRYSFRGVESPLRSTLDSTVYAEGFYGRSYAKIQGFAFQPTRIDESQRVSPFVTPLAQYNFIGLQRPRGDHFFGTSSLAVISRQLGTNTQRISVEGGWEKPIYGSLGDLYTFTLTLRGDGYHTSHFRPNSRTRSNKTSTGRLFPQTSLNWRFPLYASKSHIPLLIEPQAGIIAAPQGGNPQTIPNEDSEDFQLDETTLFARNRFPGLDRVDSGTRLNYGLVTEIMPKQIDSASFFIGQSYSFTKNKAIPQNIGVYKGASDIVTAFAVLPNQNSKIRLRSLWNKKTLKARRIQIGADVGPPIFRVSGDYLFVAENSSRASFNGKKQIIVGLSSQFAPFWRAEIEASRDLGRNGKNLAQRVALTYEDECFLARTSLTRTFYNDRDIKPDNIVLFTFGFKTLGEISTGGFNISAREKREKTATLLRE